MRPLYRPKIFLRVLIAAPALARISAPYPPAPAEFRTTLPLTAAAAAKTAPRPMGIDLLASAKFHGVGAAICAGRAGAARRHTLQDVP